VLDLFIMIFIALRFPKVLCVVIHDGRIEAETYFNFHCRSDNSYVLFDGLNKRRPLLKVLNIGTLYARSRIKPRIHLTERKRLLGTFYIVHSMYCWWSIHRIQPKNPQCFSSDRPLYVTVSYWYSYVFRSIRDHNHQGWWWWSLQRAVLQEALTPYGKWSACHRTLRSAWKVAGSCQEFSETSCSITSDNFLTSWATISFSKRRWSVESVFSLVQMMYFKIPSVSANKMGFFPP
jgi:hypothetical protein